LETGRHLLAGGPGAEKKPERSQKPGIIEENALLAVIPFEEFDSLNDAFDHYRDHRDKSLKIIKTAPPCQDQPSQANAVVCDGHGDILKAAFSVDNTPEGVAYLIEQISATVDLHPCLSRNAGELRAEAALTLAATPYALLTSIRGIGFVLSAGVAGELGEPAKLGSTDSPSAVTRASCPNTLQTGGEDSQPVEGHVSPRCNRILKDWVVQSSRKNTAIEGRRANATARVSKPTPPVAPDPTCWRNPPQAGSWHQDTPPLPRVKRARQTRQPGKGSDAGKPVYPAKTILFTREPVLWWLWIGKTRRLSASAPPRGKLAPPFTAW
jgi:hypothetical protein